MTLRTDMTALQRRAHSILDLAREGFTMSASRVRWALIVLGDLA